MPYISRGFYFREFRELVLFANSTTRENKLTSDPSIALLLDREFTHSRKCLEVPIREKLDSRNIWRIQYRNEINHQNWHKKQQQLIFITKSEFHESWDVL